MPHGTCHISHFTFFLLLLFFSSLFLLIKCWSLSVEGLDSAAAAAAAGAICWSFLWKLLGAFQTPATMANGPEARVRPPSTLSSATPALAGGRSGAGLRRGEAVIPLDLTNRTNHKNNHSIYSLENQFNNHQACIFLLSFLWAFQIRPTWQSMPWTWSPNTRPRKTSPHLYYIISTLNPQLCDSCIGRRQTRCRSGMMQHHCSCPTCPPPLVQVQHPCS